MHEPLLEIFGKSDDEIVALFAHHSVALTADEGRQIANLLKRNPTLTEATVWGIQGSEHSSYKSSRHLLKKLPTKGEHILLGPGEDAGVVTFHKSKSGEIYGIVLAHESHNHPSQVVPYEGAATGVGGICRDIACMGARVIGVLDALRFGDIAQNETKRIVSGVTAGISGYGNPLGVANFGGDAKFDSSFNENCLVNVVALGTLRWKNVLHSFVPKEAEGYEYILVGKPTDRSGFGGSSFASATLNEDDMERNKGAVQEPNPFLERHLFAAMNDLFARLEKKGELAKVALKDLGAGGVLCATVELVAESGFGAEIEVEKIHTAEDDLPAAVILCAETQERFCFAVPPHLTDFILKHFNDRWDFGGVSAGAAASYIGRVVSGGKYMATYKGESVCDAQATDITEGIVADRPFLARALEENPAVLPENFSLLSCAQQLLASENIASTRPFSETYDQTVQGNTVLQRDETEAVSFCPLADYEELSEEEKNMNAVIAVAGSARLGLVSAKNQAEHAVALSFLRCVAAGGDPLALTDCLNYGNPEFPAQMAELNDGVAGLARMAMAIDLPFVSGNVSLYNTSKATSVSPSAIVSCVAKVDNGVSPRKNSLQQTGNMLVLVGTPSGRLGGSETARQLKQLGTNLPEINGEHLKKMRCFSRKMKNKAQSSAVISEGGLLITLLKMAARSGKGAKISASFSPEEWLSEDLNTVFEIAADDFFVVKELAEECGVPFTVLGEVSEKDVEVSKVGIFSTENIADLFWNGLRQKR